MLISSKSTETLKLKLEKDSEVFCSGLFLSARWFLVSQLDYIGIQVIVMPDRDSAEYCAADLYNLIEGDCVFFLPDSGKKLEKSNYVSKVVFDTIFLGFQKLSQCLFENYNNAAVRLFPLLEQTICMIPFKEGKVLKMKEFYEKSLNDLNQLVYLTQINRFILTDEMIQMLESFETIIKEIISCYADKMTDVETGCAYTYLTREKENEMIKKGDQSMELFKHIEKIFDEYIKSLQIVE